MSRHPCFFKVSLYVVSASCLVPSSNWQHRVRCRHTAGHKMALCIFIWRPPWSQGNVKSAVGMFGDICQASLLHLTKAAESCLDSFSGHVFTGPEMARREPRVHSTNLRLFSIERSLFFRKKQAISVIPSMTYRLCAVLSSHMLYRMPRSHWQIGARPWMTFRSVPLCLIPAGFHVCWHVRQGDVGVRCAGKWQFPFFLLHIGHWLLIIARIICQSSCPFFLSCVVFSSFQDIEVTVPVKKSQETLCNFDPAAFWKNRTYLTIQTVDRQGRGVPRGERSKIKWAAQKHHRRAQSCCSKVGIWAD